MRNTFIHQLIELAQNNDKIILMVGDLGFSVVEPFVEKFPDRFINAGIAEQNMAGMAAGLASEGFIVFIYSIANFPTFRCAEQIRNDIDYHNLHVIIVSVGGGLAYGNLGYSHHAVQDYGLMRLMPNMTIASPGDPLEVRACMKFLVNNYKGPAYLRLNKAGEPTIHLQEPTVLPGKWVPIQEIVHAKNAFVTTGATMELVKEWTALEKYKKFSHYSLPLWNMKCKIDQLKQAQHFEQIYIVEDHLEDGGFSSWMRESFAKQSDTKAPQIISKALSAHICGLVGKQKTLNAMGGLIP